MGKKISVIIPAYNESGYLGNTIKEYRLQNYSDMEIVVVDNSTDEGKTRKIAESLADKVVSFSGPVGVSAARNAGVKVATGEILVFSDADSYLQTGALEEIFKISDKNTVGSFIGRGFPHNWKEVLFFFLKNTIHLLGIYKGVGGGVMFCHKDVFSKTNGFKPDKETFELFYFLKEARSFGAKYKLIKNFYASTSMRRYEQKGYIKTALLWVKIFISSFFDNKKLTKNYFKIKK